MNDAKTSAEDKEKMMFITTLAKYKYLLSPGITSDLIKRKNKGLVEFADEFNKISKQNLTRVQIHRKIGSMKAKLKEKNYRISVNNEKLVYKDWEKMFLDLWVEGDTTVLPKRIYRAAEEIETKDKDIEVRVETEDDETTDKDIETKVETEDYVLQDNSHASRDVSYQPWHSDSEPEIFDEEKYENMSLEDLERASLIAQIKALKAQERAALNAEKLKAYKLLLLTLND